MAYDVGLDAGSGGGSSAVTATPDSPESLVTTHTDAGGAFDAAAAGTQLAGIVTAQPEQAEDWVAGALAAVPPDARAALADAFIEASGWTGLNELAASLPGQHALAAAFDAAGPTGQQTLRAVEQDLGYCPAVDFAGVHGVAQSAPDGAGDEKAALLLDITQIGLAVAGIFDPTPVSDGVDGLISLGRGDWLGAGISAVSLIPYVGDLAKVGKLGRFAETVTRAVDIAATDARFAEQLRPVLAPLRDALNAVPLDDLPAAVREPLQQMKTKIDEFFDVGADAARLPDFVDGARHVDPLTGRTVIDARPGGTGDWNAAINGRLEADVIYRTDTGYLYHTDAQGRVTMVEAELVSGTAPRNGYQQGVSGREDRLPTDQGGHLIASIFLGPGEAMNLVPMDGNLNMGAWRQMEALWDDALDAGQTVQVRIDPVYGADGLRPTRFDVSYQLGNEAPVTRSFVNAPGGE